MPNEGGHGTIAVTGATGYVGGRLVPLLLDRGYRVRCLVRSPRKLEARPWRNHPRVEIAEVDVADAHTTAKALEGCSAAYNLVHSMVAAGDNYVEHDRRLAGAFAEAASRAGIDRIIYLGGLGELGDGLSKHLASRREVEQILASGAASVTVLRAAMIIGAGSASFEILRYLVERWPIMITPRWVQTENQPVAIADVLHWLAECLAVPETRGKALEIGGPDVVTYRELMQVMAQELGLRRRLVLVVPLLTPRLGSAWISLVTPVTYRVARPLAEGLRNRVVVTDSATQELMPHQALSVRQAIRESIDAIETNDVQTRWSVAGPIPGDPDWAGGTVLTDQRSIAIDAPASTVFAAVCRVGGGHGWYAGDILWRIRGWMDQVVGGPGLRRGRRHPEQVEFGEALDFWRVVGIERPKSMLLRAEMKLPGIAQLEFHTQPAGDADHTELTMTARFRPKGLAGILYWYSVLPLHHFVFGGMLQGIKRAAESGELPRTTMSHSQHVAGSSEPNREQHAPKVDLARH